MSAASPARPAPVRTILSATDFSPTAAAALQWAIELAKVHRARIVLVHALPPPIPPAASPDFVTLPPDFHEQYRDAALRKLAADVEMVRSKGVEASSDLDIGPASPLVLELATKHGADVIVLGTRGMTGFRHLLLGSTAERVVHPACGATASPGRWRSRRRHGWRRRTAPSRPRAAGTGRGHRC